MKIIISIFSVLFVSLFMLSCSICKEKTSPVELPMKGERMVFTIDKIRNEKDGQTLFLKDNKGVDYTTIISPANGNYIELEEGNRISLFPKEIMESDPAQIISSDIKIIGAYDNASSVDYEKTEEVIYWVHSRMTQAYDLMGEPREYLQYQEGERLDKTGKWDALGVDIEYFTYEEGKYYQIKVLKKWLKNHESLMDGYPYDLELITVISREKDETYIHPIKTSISTKAKTYTLGSSIDLSMEVLNTGNKPYTFLPWGTPMENSFTGDCLKIEHNGKVLNYIGIMVKRMPPTKEDYITLEKGEKGTGVVNILEGYPIQEKGVYTIQFEERGLPASNIIEIEIE